MESQAERMIVVQVRRDSEFGGLIAILNINANDRIKCVKEQIETTTGIKKCRQCLLHRFDNGSIELMGNGKVSNYCIKDGSTLVLRSSLSGMNVARRLKVRYPLKSAAAKQRSAATRVAAKQIASERLSVAAKQRDAVPALGESTGASSSQ